MSEVDSLFPRSVGSEIEGALRTMKDLPEDSRSSINTYLRDLIATKKDALMAIMDRPGNTEAYFHVGMLWIWDMLRITFGGTMPERMASFGTVYETTEKGSIIGHHEIGSYFMRKYMEKGGADPDCIAIIKGFRIIT